jgi:hypothetical protein
MKVAFQFLAIFFLVAGSMLYMFGKPKLGKEQRLWEESLDWTSDMPDVGHALRIEGIVIEENPALVEGLVLAYREEFTGTGKYNGWKPVESFLQPLVVRQGNKTIRLEIEEVPDRGSELSIVPTEERTERDMHIRYKGLRPGTTVSALGHVTALDPLTVQVDFLYAGSGEKHLALLENGQQVLNLICGSLAGIGVVFLVLFIWRKKVIESRS